MKNKNSDKNRMTAIQFMKSFDDTMKVMESIGEKTAHEQKALVESGVLNQFTDDTGVFDMDNLMDVQVSDMPENQVRLYNSPVEELSDGDKALIVDAFADQISKMQQEVIDFSDIGPIATVIQNQYGFKQNLEDFITELITSAPETQNSQAFAHGKTIPGVGISQEGEGEGSPTDIAPTEVGVGAGAGELPPVGGEDVLPPVGGEGELPPVGGEGELPPVGGEGELPPVGEEGEGELPPVGEEGEGELPPVDDVLPPVEPSDESEIEEEIKEEKEEGEEGEDELFKFDDEDDEVLAEAANLSDKTTAKGVTTSDEPKVDDDGKKQSDKQWKAKVQKLPKNDVPNPEKLGEDVDAKLESIREEYLSKMVASSLVESATAEVLAESDVDAKLEQTKNNVLAESAKSVVPTQTKTPSITAKLESIAQRYHATENQKVMVEAAQKKLDSKLKAIAESYHGEQKAKVEAAQKSKKLDAQLESIASAYHNKQKAKLEAIQAEKNIDAKLAAIVESYQSKSCKKAEACEGDNLEARKKAKSKIAEMNK